MADSGYVFVLSYLNIEAKLPQEIVPRHILKRASPEQAEVIRSLLQDFCATPCPQLPYEYDVKTRQGERGALSFDNIPLPQEQWRYWIIEFKGVNREFLNLQLACSLARPDILLGFEVVNMGNNGGRGYGWHAQSVHTFLNDFPPGFGKPEDVTDHDLRSIARYYSLWKALPDDFDHIKRAFMRFHQLRSITRHSELMVIGLFSILESLLTHAPKLSESADSLSHQFRTKIPLVRKRFERPLVYTFDLGEVAEDKLWGKLYKYRSKIVHGGHADLTGDLQVLGDRSEVIRFLREAAKLLLILGLNEPVLLTDLKAC